MAVLLDHRDFVLPAAHVARDHALRLVAEADASVERLIGHHADDAEAIHDYRVALRRLRAWLDSYGDAMGIRRKLGKRLGRRAGATSAIRDEEVTLEAMERFGRELPTAPRSALGHLIRDLQDRLGRKRAELVSDLVRGWGRERERMIRGLMEPRHEVALEAFEGLLRERVESAALKLDRGMRQQATAEEMHGTRLAIKALRYLIEPLRDAYAGAPVLVKRLRALQDVYGEFSDLEVLLARVSELMAEASESQASEMYRLSTGEHFDPSAYAALRRSDPAPALATVARFATERHRMLFEEIGTHADSYPGFVPLVGNMLDAPLSREAGDVAC